MLSFFYFPKDVGKLAAKLPLYPCSFGWMTQQGIYGGKIDPFENDTVAVDCQLISFDDTNRDMPLAFVITEFHAIVAYPKFVRGICLLNEQIVFEDDLDVVIRGVGRDAVTGIKFRYS